MSKGIKFFTIVSLQVLLSWFFVSDLYSLETLKGVILQNEISICGGQCDMYYIKTEPDTVHVSLVGIYSFYKNKRVRLTGFRSHCGDCYSFIVTEPIETLALGVFDDTIDQPGSFLLAQNYPNPFNPTTEITYRIPSESFVTLTIYNILGQEMKTFSEGFKHAGWNRLIWNAGNIGTGIYYYRVTAASAANRSTMFSETMKMILMK